LTAKKGGVSSLFLSQFKGLLLLNERISGTLEKAKSRKVLLYTKGRKYGKIEGTSQFNNTLTGMRKTGFPKNGFTQYLKA
jgi:hypothetical protein